MKNVREELNKFLDWYREDPNNYYSIPSSEDVDRYINLFYSEAPIETPNVNNNEAQEKDCDNCYFKDEPNYMNPCLCCVNHDNWTQSD